MPYTRTSGQSQPGFIADRKSISRLDGRQIDFDYVPDSFRSSAQTIKLNDASANIGDTTITVDALPVALLAGAILDFGHIENVPVALSAAAAEGATSISVTALTKPLPAGAVLDFGAWAAVTVTADAALANATSVTVAALSGPLPAGATLDFGSKKYAKLTAAAAQGATTISVAALPTALSGGETATFAAQDKIVTTSAAAAAGDTSISIVAAPVQLAATDTTTWKGGTKQVRLTANAAKGATSLTVDELQFAIPDDATATYGGSGDKVIASGTIVAELSSGKVIPRSAVTGAETAIGVLVGTAYENAKEHALTGYGVINGGVLYENLLPDRDHADFDTWITEINSAGTGVSLQEYSDSRAS